MIILDTHIWLWWLQGEVSRMKSEWVDLIEAADVIGVSAISCFEVAWLVHHGRILVHVDIRDWFQMALSGSGVDLVPLTPEIASSAVQLVKHHSDPQDRIIIATALVHDALLISADAKFPLYTELDGRLVR